MFGEFVAARTGFGMNLALLRAKLQSCGLATTRMTIIIPTI
jgi:hypothetical protein